jgi:hypothetical protein
MELIEAIKTLTGFDAVEIEQNTGLVWFRTSDGAWYAISCTLCRGGE